MSRLNTLTNLQLFTDARYRLIIKKFIQTDLNDDKLFENIDHLIYAIYDEKSNVNKAIEESILKSKLYVGFEHDANDSVLQRLIFYSVIFSFQKYPKEDEWVKFVELPDDEKIAHLFDGITLIASTLLMRDLEKKLTS
jgi:hypothetical protein